MGPAENSPHSNLKNNLANPPRILIVDDEDSLRLLFRLMLEQDGYAITEAKSGNEAWAELSHMAIDLVISDIRMPDGDGLSLLDRLHKKDPNHPLVILVTGYADITEAEALARGATRIFNKPFDYGIFRQTVRNIFARQHGE